MRIKVGVNISKPLCRGRKIRHGDGEIGWVRFKYERQICVIGVAGLPIVTRSATFGCGVRAL